MNNLKSEFEEVQLVYRNKMKAHDRPKVSSAADAFDLLHRTWDHDQIDLIEEFKILLLDQSNRVMSLANISKGGFCSVSVDLRVIFATALKRKATQLIVAHNHPSGNLHPSEADKRLTKKVVEAGKILDIGVLDHIIITSCDYKSLREAGYDLF